MKTMTPKKKRRNSRSPVRFVVTYGEDLRVYELPHVRVSRRKIEAAIDEAAQAFAKSFSAAIGEAECQMNSK